MKIVKHIPNAITSMNLLCGVLGVISAFGGRLEAAFYFMIAGAVCDFCDGLSARLLKAYSPMGKELDSLADLITFGLLPSIMLYRCMDTFNPGKWFCYIPLFIVVFSALRLAKFNIDERQSENFIGLATPACAMICGSFVTVSCLATDNAIAAIASSTWILPVASIILSLLLVSEIPMFSLKFKKGASDKLQLIRISFIVIAVLSLAVTAILGQHFAYAVLVIFIIYVLTNIVKQLTSR